MSKRILVDSTRKVFQTSASNNSKSVCVCFQFIVDDRLPARRIEKEEKSYEIVAVFFSKSTLSTFETLWLWEIHSRGTILVPGVTTFAVKQVFQQRQSRLPRAHFTGTRMDKNQSSLLIKKGLDSHPKNKESKVSVDRCCRRDTARRGLLDRWQPGNIDAVSSVSRFVVARVHKAKTIVVVAVTIAVAPPPSPPPGTT